MARSKQVKRKGQGPPAKKRAEEQLPSDLEDEVEKFHKSRDKLSLHASDGGCRAAATCGVHVQAGALQGCAGGVVQLCGRRFAAGASPGRHRQALTCRTCTLSTLGCRRAGQRLA